LLCFAAPTLVYAQDDDEEEEEEEEEEAPKKKKSSKKASKPSAPSRVGLAVSFNGNDGVVGFIYDLGSGLELGLGLGLDRKAFTPNEGDAEDPVQTITVVPSIKYSLGKTLLDYGIGADVSITSKDAGTDIRGFLNFYTSVELVKNVSLSLSAGANVNKLQWDNGSNLDVILGTKGTVIFYFM
jgi:hypothetical protein